MCRWGSAPAEPLVASRATRRETTRSPTARKPLPELARNDKRRRVSAPAYPNNRWVVKFRNDPSARGSDTVLEITAACNQRHGTGWVRRSEANPTEFWVGVLGKPSRWDPGLPLLLGGGSQSRSGVR